MDTRNVVLIVEDNALMRVLLRYFLEVEFPGLTVHEGADGAAALELATRHRPAVVLMDIRLPDADGIALTAKVMDMLPDTRVIMVTQLTGSPYVERARAAGAIGYVVKDRIHRQLSPLVAQALACA